MRKVLSTNTNESVLTSLVHLKTKELYDICGVYHLTVLVCSKTTLPPQCRLLTMDIYLPSPEAAR